MYLSLLILGQVGLTLLGPSNRFIYLPSRLIFVRSLGSWELLSLDPVKLALHRAVVQERSPHRCFDQTINLPAMMSRVSQEPRQLVDTTYRIGLRHGHSHYKRVSFLFGIKQELSYRYNLGLHSTPFRAPSDLHSSAIVISRTSSTTPFDTYRRIFVVRSAHNLCKVSSASGRQCVKTVCTLSHISPPSQANS